MLTHYCQGLEDGVSWYVDFVSSENKWVVVAEKNGIKKEDSFTGYEPRFGVDMCDLSRIEKLLDDFINDLK